MSQPILTELLGRRVRLMRAPGGFAPGSDAVLLAAACPAAPGDTVLDLGCGSGAAMLCVAARVAGVTVTGLDIDAEAVAWAHRNLADNGVTGTAMQGDIAEPPAAIRGQQFGHVICNPPYFTSGSPSPDPLREAARRGIDLGPWLDAATRRAGPKGSVTVIARADRLADILLGMRRLGRIAIKPLTARSGRSANRVVVQGWTGARAPLALLAPLILHRGEAHRDGDEHTPEAQAILRDVAPLPMR